MKVTRQDPSLHTDRNLIYFETEPWLYFKNAMEKAKFQKMGTAEKS